MENSDPSIYATMKPLNTIHSRSLIFFLLFGGFRYSEGSDCIRFVVGSQENILYQKVSTIGMCRWFQYSAYLYFLLCII